MYQGAVFFDADGTLIDSAAGILTPTRATVAAIVELRARGWFCALATGRAKCYAPEGAPPFDGYVTSNGAHAEANGNAVSDCFIEHDTLGRLCRFLDETGLNYVVEGQERCYCRDLTERWYKHMMHSYNFSERHFYPLTELPARANKLMVTYDAPEKLSAFQSAFGEEYDITGQPNNQAADVGTRGISKAYGAGKLLEHLGIPRESTIAFGDADNDRTLFQLVGRAVAMGRHTEAIGAAASMITGTVAEEGIATALRRMNLID